MSGLLVHCWRGPPRGSLVPGLLVGLEGPPRVSLVSGLLVNCWGVLP